MANTYKFGKFRNDFAPAQFEGNSEDRLAITSSEAVAQAKSGLSDVVSLISKELDNISKSCDTLNKHAKSGLVAQRQTKNAKKHVDAVKTEFSNAVTTLNNALNEAIMNGYMDYIANDDKSAASEAASGSVESMSATKPQ